VESVWKLDLALHGHGTEELLDSYSNERLPVIKRVIDMTHFMTIAMGTSSKFAQGMRDLVIPVVSRLAPFQEGFVQTLSELGVPITAARLLKARGNAISMIPCVVEMEFATSSCCCWGKRRAR
jgi:FAD binding domain-containing protein